MSVKQTLTSVVLLGQVESSVTGITKNFFVSPAKGKKI